MNEEFENNSSIDTELQVRLMNLVMGEASDFERDQLQAMMEQQPELAAYYQHLEHLNGLLCEVGAGEPSMESDATDSQSEWRLPPEQREKLLAVLNGPILSPSDEIDQQKTTVELARSISTKLKSYLTRRWLSGLAVAAASLLLGFMIFPRSRFGKDQLVSERANVSFAGETTTSRYFKDPPTNGESTFGFALGRGSSIQADLEKVKAELKETQMAMRLPEAPTTSQPPLYYLMDDAQYDYKAPNVATTLSAPNSYAASSAGDISQSLSNSLAEGRFDRGRQGRQAGDDLSAENMPRSNTAPAVDGIASFESSPDGVPSVGGMGGGGMGGGMGELSKGLKASEGSKGMDDPRNAHGIDKLARGGDVAGSGNSNRHMELTDGRELAGAESVNKNLFKAQGLGDGPADTRLDSLTSQVDQSGQVQPLNENEFGESLAFNDIPISRERFGSEAGAKSKDTGEARGWSIEKSPDGWADSTFAQSGVKQDAGIPLPAYATPEFDGESKSEKAAMSVPGSVEQPHIVTGSLSVPDGGSIALGTIRKNQPGYENAGSHNASTLMMNVTPRIIIQEEEEASRPLISEADTRDSARQLGMSVLEDIYGANETSRPSMAVPNGTLYGRGLDAKSGSLDSNGNIVRDALGNGVQVRDATRELARSPGSDDFYDSRLLGEVQFETVDPLGAIIVKGSDVVRTADDAISEVKKQVYWGSDSERALDASGVKAETNGRQSQANTEWYKKQIEGFQATNGNRTVTNEQVAELNREYLRPQDGPIDASDFGTNSLLRGDKQGPSDGASENTLSEVALQQLTPPNATQSNSKKISPTTREEFSQQSGDESPKAEGGQVGLLQKENDKSSAEIAKNGEPNTEPQPSDEKGLASKPASTPTDSPDLYDDFVRKDTENAPSPEAIVSGRHRRIQPPVTARKPADGKLADSEVSREPVGESKFAKGKALSQKPAEPNGEELARIDAKTKLLRNEKRPSIDEQSAAKEAFSTFSLHVSDVSFKLAQAALSQGQWPEAAKIRIEEFVNALDYRDPLPSGNERVACRIEQAIHPFLIQRNMLRVSMRTAATGRSQNTPLRLTILLDNSGSMERPDRRQAVLRAFQTLTLQLKATDQVTLISFASTPRLLADKVAGNQGEALLQVIENLPSEGGTNIESALMLAREKAAEQQLAGAQNRIVLLTDGAVNLGNANPDSLAKIVTGLRDSGIAFDAAGISAHDLNDEVLEALTRQGDGRYYLLDSAQSANESFAAQIAGALRPSAQNVKVQVEFNPQRVGRYKLLGYEKHRLNKEDFRNDKVDAAEMAASEAGVAVYQFEIKPNGTGDVGSVSVRFRDLATGKMVENRWPIPYESNAPRLEQAEPTMKLAASAALLAAKLSGGPLGDNVDLAQLQKLLTSLPEQVASQTRVKQLRAMIDQASVIK